VTIKIGRAGRDTALPLRSPRHWSMAGDIVTLDGTLDATSYAGLVILRSQVNGLADNPDEAAVAVNWAGDASVDGYYEVVDAEVPMPPRGLAALSLNYRLRLRRVAVYPEINSLIVGDSVRTNSHGIVKANTVPWWATPADAAMDYVPGTTVTTRATETGTVKVAYTTNGTVLYDRTCRWQCLASDYYDGAARIEITDGFSWYALVGRRLPNTSATAGWRVNNGLVRVVYGGGNGLLSVQHYVSGAWLTAKVYKLTRGISPSTPTALGPFTTISVVRNAPECVILRLGVEQDSSTYPAAVNVDICLRRGAMWADIIVTRSADQVSTAELASTDFPLGIERNTAEAGTTHTSGVHATAASGGGKYVLTSCTATNVDTTQGAIRQGTGVNLFQVQVSLEPTGASGPDTFTNQVYAFMANQDETVGFARR
jgi:hypothetical protein